MTTALLVCVLFVSRPADAPASTVPSAQPEAQAVNDGTVRMRKLHLVRPELIPYPVAYEIYC